jgi:hypothetical protein
MNYPNSPKGLYSAVVEGERWAAFVQLQENKGPISHSKRIRAVARNKFRLTNLSSPKYHWYR